jgi:GTP-binding protein HflX
MTATRATESENARERAALIGLERAGQSPRDVEQSLAELRRLVTSAGADVVGARAVSLREPKASTLLSKGHLEDLAQWAERVESDLVVLDDEMTPGQQRNLERAFGRRVLTRTEVILDIFATHAKTRESMTQVELAQLRYRLPRLIGAPIATARMGGVGGEAGGRGRIATRGPGETQLEVDRRRIRSRLRHLEKTLELIRQRRQTQRRRRMRSGIPLVGLVGYTNAGKSTLLNHLTNAGILAEDRLFSTLDTTVRTLALPSGLEVGLIDTVGFVSKLPPTLIAAFRATLEEVTFADVILHIVDASSPRQDIEFAATEDILRELQCESKPRLTAWNKIDRLDDPVEINALTLRRAPSAAISALYGTGVEGLLEEIERLVMACGVPAVLCIPYDRYDLVARLHRESQVVDSRDTGEGKVLRCRLAPHLYDLTAPFRLDRWPEESEEAGAAHPDSPMAE